MLAVKSTGQYNGKTRTMNKKINFCAKAVDFLKIMQADPKNKHRKVELECCSNELVDYFMGENIYNTTEEQLIRYYDAFIH